jgi:ubiquinone/menaquinone biosynthesis C-methylase UbiE
MPTSHDWFYEQATKAGYPKRLLEVDDYEAFAELCKTDNPNRILDIGCGAGLLPKVLNQRNGIFGLDANYKNTVCSTCYAPSINALAEELPFLAESFDKIIYIKTFSLLNWTRALKESFRVLIPNGTLIIAEQEDGWWNFAINSIQDELVVKGLVPSSRAPEEHDCSQTFSWQRVLSILDKKQSVVSTIQLEIKSSYSSLADLVDRLVYYSPISTMMYQNMIHEKLIRSLVENFARYKIAGYTGLRNTYKVVSIKNGR